MTRSKAGGINTVSSTNVSRSTRAAVVEIAGEVRSLERDHDFIFGRVSRPGVIGLDPDDTGISRVAGKIVSRAGGWLLENLSKGRPLYVEYASVVRHQRLAPAETSALVASAIVLVPGKAYTHSIAVTLPPIDRPKRHRPLDAASVTVTDHDPYTHEDKCALVALCEGYLQRWPRHDPNPCSYEEAAAKLNWTTTALRKRLEHVRERLAERETLLVSGPHGLRALVDHAIDTGVVGVADLELLNHQLPGESP